MGGFNVASVCFSVALGDCQLGCITAHDDALRRIATPCNVLQRITTHLAVCLFFSKVLTFHIRIVESYVPYPYC